MTPSNKPENYLPIRKALLWIVLSTLCISGTALIGVLYYNSIKKQRFAHPDYNIVAILQTTSDKERLKTVYFSELLNLSLDRPINLFKFNLKQAKTILLSSPLITSAHVKKIMPGTLYVDYTLRKPFAYLMDFTNTVLDHEGVPFPFNPFFTPKKLPEIYLGLDDQSSISWGSQLKGIKVRLALYLVDFIRENCCQDTSFLTRVDVSHILADSHGQRQIIVMIEEGVERTADQSVVSIPFVLRLGVDNYLQGLANFLALRPNILEKLSLQSDKSVQEESIVIDLRIPELAYIKDPKH